MMKRKTWALLSLALLLGTIGAICLTVIVIDPFQVYHLATRYMPPIDNTTQVYANAGIARSYDYDSAVVGTSVTENFRPTQMDALLGGRFIKLCTSAGTAYNHALLMDLAFRTHDVKRIVYGLDVYSFIARLDQTGSDVLTNQGYDICFDHVAFSYKSGEQVLSDVSFTAKQGEVTALIGPSGGGKTTVSRLAARFWDNDKGKITVGGMDVSRIDPEKLLSMYAIVFQDVTLFNNTVLENIRIGRKDATDEEVMAAAKLAHCEDFVERMPDKWNSMIGENGSELSGGERQRISIARAFLKDAPIILMDEATASLDVDNESLIQESISKLIRNKTVLIIAHRMRTVDGVDKIVVLKDGKVAEMGSPDALRAENGIYKHMIDTQVKTNSWKY